MSCQPRFNGTRVVPEVRINGSDVACGLDLLMGEFITGLLLQN